MRRPADSDTTLDDHDQILRERRMLYLHVHRKTDPMPGVAEKQSEVLPSTVTEHDGSGGGNHGGHDRPTTIVAASDLPPDGGYAWVCCGAMALLNAFTWGVSASYGVFISHYLDNDFFPGATTLDYALIGGLEFGLALLISPLCTVLTRELGRRTIMSAGTLMVAGGFVAASFSTQIWQLYLTQGVLIGLGIGFIFVPSISVLPQWFQKRRSLANGIASFGTGLGGLVFSLATNAMIEQISLSWSLRIIGIVCLVANSAGTMLLRDRNHVVKPPQVGFAFHLLRRYDCLLLLAWAFIHIMGYMIVLYSLSDYAVLIADLSQSQASVLTAVLNLGTAFGGPIIGTISDRYGRIKVAAIITLLNAFGIFAIWIPAANYGVLLFFALVVGGLIGVFWVTIPPLCAEVAGLAELPSFLSLQWMVVAFPCTFGEVIGLYLRRPNLGRWTYLYAQVFGGLCYLVGSLFLFELWRVKRRQTRVARHGHEGNVIDQSDK